MRLPARGLCRTPNTVRMPTARANISRVAAASEARVVAIAPAPALTNSTRAKIKRLMALIPVIARDFSITSLDRLRAIRLRKHRYFVEYRPFFDDQRSSEAQVCHAHDTNLAPSRDFSEQSAGTGRPFEHPANGDDHAVGFFGPAHMFNPNRCIGKAGEHRDYQCAEIAAAVGDPSPPPNVQSRLDRNDHGYDRNGVHSKFG